MQTKKQSNRKQRGEKPAEGRFPSARHREKRLPKRRSSDGVRPVQDDSLMTFGRNSVTEFLRADRVRSVFIKEGRKDERLARIAEEAISKGLPVIEIAEDKLDAMAGGVVHQGAAALLKPYEYAELDKVLSDWEGKDPILILLDGLEDVRNLGAIVRTAECAGAAVLLPKHKSPPVTAAAMKTAAGAFAYLPVCQTGNIRQTLEGLKEKGFWVVGADMGGESLYYEANLKGPLVIVMGAEGKGVSPLTRKLCDFCVRIPMKGKVSSLNVSVAAALLIYEAAKQRGE